MKCIYCNCTESRVVDSRPTEDGAIRRRGSAEEILPQILSDTLGNCPVLNKEVHA